MIDHIIKKHVTLRAAPEQRVIGDMTGWGRDAEPDLFLRGVVQWRKEAPSKDSAPPPPLRDQELRS